MHVNTPPMTDLRAYYVTAQSWTNRVYGSGQNSNFEYNYLQVNHYSKFEYLYDIIQAVF